MNSHTLEERKFLGKEENDRKFVNHIASKLSKSNCWSAFFVFFSEMCLHSFLCLLRNWFYSICMYSACMSNWWLLKPLGESSSSYNIVEMRQKLLEWRGKNINSFKLVTTTADDDDSTSTDCSKEEIQNIVHGDISPLDDVADKQCHVCMGSCHVQLYTRFVCFIWEMTSSMVIIGFNVQTSRLLKMTEF